MSSLCGKRLLVVALDDAQARDTVEVCRSFAEAGAEVGVWVAPGAERWFGTASLSHLSASEGYAISRVARDWSADAALLLGDASALPASDALRTRMLLLSPVPEADCAPLLWGVSVAARALSSGPLRGLRVLVTAGPTVEHFDAVRFLSNPSSGKMGYAVAEAAWIAGAEVTLVSGPTALKPPFGIRCILVSSASEMREAVLEEQYDVVFMAAAVSDYRPIERRVGKVKKGLGPWTLEMERTPDILAELSASVVRPELLIGFAAETHDIERYAREKLRAKSLDGIVANDVGAGGAFGSDRNCVQCYDGAGGAVSFGPAAKREIAAAIVAWADGCLARKR